MLGLFHHCWAPMENNELRKLIRDLEDILEKASPTPWNIECNSRNVSGAVWQESIWITSPNKPNESYPGRPGIVAHIEGPKTFEREHEAIKKVDQDLMQAAINSLPILLKELKIRLDDKIVWLIRSSNPEKLAEAMQLAREGTKLENVYTNDIRRFPNGVEQVTYEDHLFSDYFESIEVLPVDEKTFHIIFHKKENAKRFWKNLLVQLLVKLLEIETISSRRIN